uniref:Putative ovule protein n=1 Tax=Solanum chacoense TaxID=4108 RepID=A0A0V0GU54_SOLCH
MKPTLTYISSIFVDGRSGELLLLSTYLALLKHFSLEYIVSFFGIKYLETEHITKEIEALNKGGSAKARLNLQAQILRY